MSRCRAASCQGQAGAGTQGPEVPRTRGGEGQSAGRLRWLESAGQDWGREKKAEKELWNPAPDSPRGLCLKAQSPIRGAKLPEPLRRSSTDQGSGRVMSEPVA